MLGSNVYLDGRVQYLTVIYNDFKAPKEENHYVWQPASIGQPQSAESVVEKWPDIRLEVWTSSRGYEKHVQVSR